MKKSYLMMAIMLFAALSFTACKKGGSSDKKVDSTKIKDSLAAIEANKPEKLIAQNWMLSESKALKEELKDDKKYDAAIKAAMLNFTGNTFEMSHPADAKKVFKGNYALIEDGKKIYREFNDDKNKPVKDTIEITTLSKERLSFTLKDGKKSYDLTYSPKK